MSLLTTVVKFCRVTNIPAPATAFGSTDPQIQQVVGLLSEECTDLASRGDWSQLINEAIHTTLAAEDQGAMTDIAPNGFRNVVNNTMWDRDLRLPIFVINQAEWQQVKAVQVTGPRHQARIRAGRLLSNPAPAARHVWVFEYISDNWALDTNGTTFKPDFTADTDTFVLPDKLVLAGLRWRWKKEKQLEYEEDFNTYERLVSNALSRDGLHRPINMGKTSKHPTPGVMVPQGNWLQP